MKGSDEGLLMNRQYIDQYRSKNDFERIEQRKRDKILSRPILWYLFLTVVCVFGRDSFLAPLGIAEEVYYYLRYGATAMAALYAVLFIKKKFVGWLVGMEVFFGLSYIFAYLQDNMLQGNILVYIVTTLIVCIPGAVFLASIEDYEYFYQRLKITSIFVSAMCIFYLFSHTFTDSYSMPASYQILWCSVLHVNEIFKKKQSAKERVFFIALSAVEIVVIFIRGARGPLLCFAVYITAKTIIEMRNNVKAMAFALVGMTGLAILAQNAAEVTTWIGGMLNQAGLYSRNLQYILSKSIFDGSGRGVWRSRAIDLIWESAFFGYGASSDVKLLGGQYTHSLPLELMFDFGVFFGGVIFVLICIYVIKTFTSEEGVKRDLKLILLTEGFVMLFFSGTYLQSIFLFLFVGVVLSEKHRYKITLGRRH